MEGSSLIQTRGTISQFAWRHRGIWRETSVRIGGLWTEIWTRNFQNRNQNANHSAATFGLIHSGINTMNIKWHAIVSRSIITLCEWTAHRTWYVLSLYQNLIKMIDIKISPLPHFPSCHCAEDFPSELDSSFSYYLSGSFYKKWHFISLLLSYSYFPGCIEGLLLILLFLQQRFVFFVIFRCLGI